MADVRLGAIVESIEFSEEEKVRILNGLKDKNSSLHKSFTQVILSSNTIEPKDSAWIAKKLKLFGLRDGGDQQREKIIERLTTFAVTRGGTDESIFWQIYRMTVSCLIIKKFTKLNELLHKVVTDDQDQSTAKIFAHINRERTQFKVSLAEVKSFYELWGFNRDATTSQLFDNQDTNVDTEELENLKLSLKKNQSRITELAEEIRDEFNSKIVNLCKAVDDIDKPIEKLRLAQTLAAKEATERYEGIDKSIEYARKEIRNLPDQRTIKSIKQEMESLGSEIEKINHNISKNSGNAVKARQRDLQSKRKNW
ncbi:MAG: hypothetical protein IPK68_22635 [Bdellovibrionales bacterium]|nr:hypothetical protein [Bdellovibrionales bacterium]